MDDRVDLGSVRRLSKELAAADRKTIAQLVKCRRQVKATQADIAELLGVSTEWVADIEAYDSDPRLSELRRYQNIIAHLYEAGN